MNLRVGLFATILFSLASLIPNQAQATTTLLGAGKTVQAFYYNGVLASPEGELPVGSMTDDPASLVSPVSYQQGAADFSSIVVGGTQITITNLAPSGAPFCVSNNSGNTCPDVIDGFDFKFTGENITGVSVDGLSAAAFDPVSGAFQGNMHLGLQLISPNEIRIDVTGDAPAHNAELILDVENTPEPSSTWIFALLGFGVLTREAYRRRRVCT